MPIRPVPAKDIPRRPWRLIALVVAVLAILASTQLIDRACDP